MKHRNGKVHKEYLVVGSNNFWYASAHSKTGALKIARDAMNERESSYEDPESGHTPDIPENVYVYEARKVDRIESKGD